jgi:hypothetical protein
VEHINESFDYCAYMSQMFPFVQLDLKPEFGLDPVALRGLGVQSIQQLEDLIEALLEICDKREKLTTR